MTDRRVTVHQPEPVAAFGLACAVCASELVLGVLVESPAFTAAERVVARWVCARNLRCVQLARVEVALIVGDPS